MAILLILYFLLSVTSIKLLIPTLKKLFIDNPNKRSSHKESTPSGAGMVFVCLTALSSFHTSFITPLVCLPLAIIGFIDDHKDVSPLIRIFFQIITVSALVFLSPLIRSNWSSNSGFIFSILIIAIVFIGTLFINIFNFIDGLDGLLALTMSVILITASIFINQNLLFLSASLLGFLTLNWSPARVFMGDGGSTFLGSIFVGIVLESLNIQQAMSVVLLASPLIADCTICIIRRYINRQSLFKAHKLHLFQRLHQAGWSHSKVSISYGLCIAALSLASIYTNIFTMILISLIILYIGIWLDKNIAVPFNKANLHKV